MLEKNVYLCLATITLLNLAFFRQVNVKMGHINFNSEIYIFNTNFNFLCFQKIMKHPVFFLLLSKRFNFKLK